MRLFRIVAKRKHRRAFSLVEVTMALGIMAFALVAILGLIPIGLSTMQSAIDDSTSCFIAKRVISDIQQNSLDAVKSAVYPVRSFDVEGQELVGSNSSALYQASTTFVSASSSNLGEVVIVVTNRGSNNAQRTYVAYVAKN